MQTTPTRTNIKQAVPFLWTTNMEASLRFYVDGLGFTMVEKWMPEGKIEWCWLKLGEAAIMLQEYQEGLKPDGILGLGVSICFICADALAYYREVTARKITASEPFVGNNFWIFEVADPDGYRLNFESPTDVPEETRYSEWKQER
ncbi:MAG TPA: VOC family protein [Niastella sp.]